MPKFNIRQTVEYYAEGIEAESEDEARDIYLKDQDTYYVGVDEEEIEEVEWCDDCDSEEIRCQCDEEEFVTA